MGDTERILIALDRAGYRLTDARRALAALIAERDGHFTVADLVAMCRARHLGVGRATVFRTIDALESLDVIERLDLPNGEHAYVECERAHHHHVVCSRCGRTEGIEDAGLRTLVAKVSRQTGFRIDEHRLELFGLCPACLALQPVPSTATA
jgi:Fur family ferric uptake transcriptional regulator